MTAVALAASVDPTPPALVHTPSTSRQLPRQTARRRLTERERAQLHDDTKRAISDALFRWSDAHRHPGPGAPAWAVDPIPVVDHAVPPSGRTIRVQGGSEIAPAEWIRRRAIAIDSCRDARAFRDDSCGRWTVQATSCHVRACPDCESQRQARALDVYGDVAAERMRDPRFVTLTIRNVRRGELRAGIRRLRRSVARLTRRGLVAGGRCRYRSKCGATRGTRRDGRPVLCDRPKRQHVARADGSLPLAHAWRSRCEARDPFGAGHEPARGGLVSIEVTYNADTDTWHPHAHLLIDGAFLPWRELRASWHDVTGDSWVVDVRRVDATPRPDESRVDAMRRAVRETVKYSTKPTPELLARGDAGPIFAELLVALRGQRLVSTFGSLYGLAADELFDPPPDRDTVTVGDPDDPHRRWRLPRLCPHVDDQLGEHVAAWSAPVWAPRAECVRVRGGPSPGALSWSPP